MRKPNLFIVGAPKCGTTSLHNYLAAHPQCFMSKIKEPGYFSRAAVRPEFRSMVPYLNTVEAYLELFSDAAEQQVIIGESSTSYLRDPVALTELQNFAVAPRIIAVVRDPVRLISSYFHFLKFQGFEPLPNLREAWQHQDERCAGNVDSDIVQRPDSLAYRNVAMLGFQIDRLLKMFGHGNVLILLADDLRVEPVKSGSVVQEFLGVTYRVDIEMPTDNVARVARIQLLDDLIA